MVNNVNSRIVLFTYWSCLAVFTDASYYYTVSFAAGVKKLKLWITLKWKQQKDKIKKIEEKSVYIKHLFLVPVVVSLGSNGEVIDAF